MQIFISVHISGQLPVANIEQEWNESQVWYARCGVSVSAMVKLVNFINL